MSQNNPLVSILIPVYGVEKYITRCLKSIEDQIYDNLEVILVNDCTPDRSIHVAEEFLGTSKIKDVTRIVHHEKNRGLSAARNTAIAAATGEYVLHLDSDDFIDKGTIEETVAFAQEEDADAVLFGFTHKYASFDRIEHISIPKDKTECIKLILQRQIPVCLCGGLYKRELYWNGVEELEGYDYEEDYVTKPRLLYYANKIVAYDKPFYVYSHEGEGSMTRRFKKKCIEDTLVTMDTLQTFFKKTKECSEYMHSLEVGSLKLKANLLRNWCLNNGGKEDWNSIRGMYRSLSLYREIGIKDNLSLVLSNLNMPYILRLFNKSGNRTKYILKKLLK